MSMEIKKAKEADLEGKRGTWFVLGLVFVLSLFFVAMEYTDRDVTESDDDEMLENLSQDVEMLTMKRNDEGMVALAPPRPRKKQEPTKIKVVDKPTDPSLVAALPDEAPRQDAEGDATGRPVTKNGETDQTQAALPVGSDMDSNPLDFRTVEDLPQFPGGAVELMKWLTKHLRYPAKAQREKVQGKVMVQFIVAADGTVTGLKIHQSLSADCDREALRVVRMMPKWKPGLQKGKPCRTMVRMPIVFKL